MSLVIPAEAGDEGLLWRIHVLALFFNMDASFSLILVPCTGSLTKQSSHVVTHMETIEDHAVVHPPKLKHG